MAWTWNEIRDEWLAGGLVAGSPQQIVDAFNLAESVFGRAWVEKARGPMGTATGSYPVIHVVYTAMLLRALEDVDGAQRLIEKLRRDESGSRGEAIACWLLRQTSSDLHIEYEPEAGGTTRIPDFRLRRSTQNWIYVEVASPQASESRRLVMKILGAFSLVLDQAPGSYGLEAFFYQEPGLDTLDEIRHFLADIAQSDRVGEWQMPRKLGLVVRTTAGPGHFSPTDHGRPHVPRLSQIDIRLGPSGHRHLAVRIPYTDNRARGFLRSEAKQLPEYEPGLIMFNMSGAHGGWEAWEPILQQALHPGQHTRVGGIVMFDSAIASTDAGESWPHVRAKMFGNPNAKLALPSWFAQGIPGERWVQ